MDRGNKIAAWVGVVIGTALSGFVLFYLPMKSNYDECGKITLCISPTPTTEE